MEFGFCDPCSPQLHKWYSVQIDVKFNAQYSEMRTKCCLFHRRESRPTRLEQGCQPPIPYECTYRHVNTNYHTFFHKTAACFHVVVQHGHQVPRNKNCMSSGVKLSIADASLLIVELIMLAFFSCNRTILDSTESSIQRRVIEQGRVWPIRWQRSADCHSAAGFHQLNDSMLVTL